jgi:hypothetical protein
LAVYPGVSVGTTNPRIDLMSSSAPVLAQMIATVACEPLVIHILVPFSTQPSAVSRAVVSMPPGLEPKSGSVSPKHPISWPAASRGSQCRFCSSEPNEKMGYITSAPCTDAKERMPLSPRSSSCMMSP